MRSKFRRTFRTDVELISGMISFSPPEHEADVFMASVVNEPDEDGVDGVRLDALLGDGELGDLGLNARPLGL